MAAPRLLLKTDLAGLQPLILRGQPVQALYQRLADQLAAKGAPAALFAEPISGAGAISWYGEAAGEPQPLPSLSSARRAEAEAALTRQLQALEPLLDDLNTPLALARLRDLRTLANALTVGGSPNVVLERMGLRDAPEIGAVVAAFREAAGVLGVAQSNPAHWLQGDGDDAAAIEAAIAARLAAVRRKTGPKPIAFAMI